ncbi:hypothetical protein [Anaerobium acetethylicum]|uniref:hypothetical protein n=1 Tax=Anaerobium acetethylicum TaxID=1619234 RepID=UPI001470D622|nr:hypothetical protein [Anaerobium acetethylicum]
MKQIKKKHLYITAVMIIVLSIFMNLVVSSIFHLNWLDKEFVVFRVIADFSFSFILVLNFLDISKVYKKYDEIKLRKSCILVGRIIFSVTLIICFLESIRTEMLMPGRVDFGMNIIVAGTVAEFGNLILRKPVSIMKKIVILISLMLAISFLLFGIFCKWIQLISI